jgi:hypothetical protein
MNLVRLRFPFTFPTRSPSAVRPRRIHARRRVIAGLVFALLFPIVLNVTLDTVKPEWRDPEYGHRLKQLRALKSAYPNRPLLVVLGSSRPQMGLSPAMLGLGEGPADPIAYNVSMAGCGPLHERLNLQRLIADGVTPDYLLVEVLSPVLAGESPAEKLLLPAKQSFADVRRAAPYCEEPGDLWAEWAKVRVNPWYNLRLNLMSHGLGGLLHWKSRQDFMWKQMQPDGWLPYFFPEVGDAKRADGIAQARAQYAPYFGNYRVAPLPDRAYRDLIAECRSRNIKLAFFVMPEGPVFRGWYPPGVRDRVTAYLAGLSAGFGVPVFDAHDWLADESMFADSHHLMRHGAEAFSHRFGHECVGPWVKGTKP